MSIERYFSPLPKNATLPLSWKPLEKYVMQQLKLGLPRVTHDYRNDCFLKLIFAADLKRRIIRVPTVVVELELHIIITHNTV